MAQAIQRDNLMESERLGREGITPLLALLRIGERADTDSYAKSLEKNALKSGVAVRRQDLPADLSQEEAEQALEALNRDESVHGILLLRPLPPQLSEEALCRRIAPSKDVDGASPLSLAGIFGAGEEGFAPATPRAVMEILRYYGIPLRGKHAVIVGRSLVVGRPLAMMLLARDATVTICHSRTENLAEHTRRADLLVAAMGRPEAMGEAHLGTHQVILDVGIHRKEDGSLCGDVYFPQAEPLAAAITPVPGGVGAVTTAVLLRQVLEAARRNIR